MKHIYAQVIIICAVLLAGFTSGAGTLILLSQIAPFWDANTLILSGSGPCCLAVNTAIIASRLTASQGIDTFCQVRSGSATAYVGAMLGNRASIYAEGMRVLVDVDVSSSGGAITLDCGAGPVPVYENDGATVPIAAHWQANSQKFVVYTQKINAPLGIWRILI